jgi:hypothetical protein
MQVQLDIPFNQLVRIVKNLPIAQQRKLKSEIEKETKIVTSSMDLEALLLGGPVATKEDLERIADNRKAINQWRKK